MFFVRLIAILISLASASSMATPRLNDRDTSSCQGNVGNKCDPDSFMSSCCDDRKSIHCVSGVILSEVCNSQSFCADGGSEGAFCLPIGVRIDVLLTNH